MYLLIFALVAVCRVADLLTTFLVSPDLRLERNWLYRRMGWRWIILLNIALCFGSPRLPWAFWGTLCLLSVAVAIWHLYFWAKNSC